MKNKLIALVILFPSICFAQKTMTGRIVDAETKKFIKEASIKIFGTNIETKTNALGFFQIDADSTNQLVVTSTGYQAGIIDVPPMTNTIVQISLSKRKEIKYEINNLEFFKYLAKNLRYPAQARRNNTQGTVYVRFDLDSINGYHNVELINDIGDGCGQDVVRVLTSEENKWVPDSGWIKSILPVSYVIIDASKAQVKNNKVELPGGTLISEVTISIFGLNHK